MDAISASISAAGLTDALTPSSVPRAAARPEDVARFEAAMASPPDATAPQPATYLLPVEGEAAPSASPSLGETILAAVESVRGAMDDAVASIRGVLESQAELTVPQMLELQMVVGTLSVQQELLGKIAGKTSQDIDQLMKAQ